jgi:hypothetical protein
VSCHVGKFNYNKECTCLYIYIYGDVTVVRMGGSIDVDRIGESDTKKDADVVANDANACCTGVYVELVDAVVVSMASDDSSISCHFCFCTL